MKLPIVLVVAVVFAALRFLRVSLLIWAGAWWIGIYVLLRFGFSAPIPSSVISIYMGIVTLAILAYVSSSEQRRLRPALPVHDREALHAVPGGDRARDPGPRRRQRLRPDERAARAAALLADGTPCLAVGRHGPRQADRPRRRRKPLPPLRDVERAGVPQARRERAPRLLPELRLLPRRQPRRQRHVRARARSHSHQLQRQGHHPDAARDLPLLAHLEGRPGTARRRRSVGHGHAGM